MYSAPQKVELSLGSGQPFNMAKPVIMALPRLPSPMQQTGMLMNPTTHSYHSSTVMGGQPGNIMHTSIMSQTSI